MRVKIDRLGINGEGIALLEKGVSSKVCFVNGALPGEEVEINIMKETSKFSIAKLENIINA